MQATVPAADRSHEVVPAAEGEPWALDEHVQCRATAATVEAELTVPMAELHVRCRDTAATAGAELTVAVAEVVAFRVAGEVVEGRRPILT